MSSDLLSNMVSSLKNASKVGKGSIEVPYSGLCEEVAKVLKKRGYLSEVKSFKESEKKHKKLRLDLAFIGEECVIKEAKRVSKPGRRIYRSSNELYTVKGNEGVLVISTSRGVMDALEARKKKLGGELICEVF